MRREILIGCTAVLVVGGTALLVVLVPGVLAEQRQEPRPGSIGIDEVSIAAGPVSGASATLQVDVRLGHRRGPSENVSVEFRAVDAESGLVAARRTVPVGTVSAEGQRRVLANLSVPREGGYRIAVTVFEDGRRVDTGETTVGGVGSLDPAYARSPVRFERFDQVGATDLPVIEYSIAGTDDRRVRLDVSTYLTNGGDDPAGNLRVVFKARQADSNIVADSATVSVGEIRPGRSATPGTELEVPDDYNYYLDAVLWKDGVIVDTARSTATLNPNESISVNRSRGEDGLRVGEFQRDGSDGEGEPPETPEQEEGGGSGDGGGGAGFGAVAVLAAVLVVAAALARGGDDDE